MEVFQKVAIITEKEARHLVCGWVKSVFGDIPGISSDYLPSINHEEPTITLFSDNGADAVKDAVQAKFDDIVKQYRELPGGNRLNLGDASLTPNMNLINDEIYQEWLEDVKADGVPNFEQVGAFPIALSRAIIAQEANWPFYPSYAKYIDIYEDGNEKMVFSAEPPHTVEIVKTPEEF